MKKNSKKSIFDYMNEPPSLKQKAWGIINTFYHEILSIMDEKNIKQVDIAKKLGVSKAAVSTMFNGTPKNVSILKMVELADAVGASISITINSESESKEIKIVNESKETILL